MTLQHSTHTVDKYLFNNTQAVTIKNIHTLNFYIIIACSIIYYPVFILKRHKV